VYVPAVVEMSGGDNNVIDFTYRPSAQEVDDFWRQHFSPVRFGVLSMLDFLEKALDSILVAKPDRHYHLRQQLYDIEQVIDVLGEPHPAAIDVSFNAPYGRLMWVFLIVFEHDERKKAFKRRGAQIIEFEYDSD